MRWARGRREAALAWVVWLAASGLSAEELSSQSLSPGPLLLAGGIGLIVDAGLGVALSASELDVAKTATIRPVTRPAPDETAATMSWLPVRTTSSAALWGKRVFDITGALVLLALSSPVLLVVAFAIKAHDRGPVFFRQTRMGLLGQQFEMVKFRSMVTDAEARRGGLEGQSERGSPLFKTTNDPRMTPIGRLVRELSIDELPQLVNIVRGDMSLVGPRPALPDECGKFDLTLGRQDLVTPGLIGLWQAEARTDASFAGQTDGIDLSDSLGLLDITDLREAVGELETDGAGGNDDPRMPRSTKPSSAIL